TTSRLRVEHGALYMTAPLIIATGDEPWITCLRLDSPSAPATRSDAGPRAATGAAASTGAATTSTSIVASTSTTSIAATATTGCTIPYIGRVCVIAIRTSPTDLVAIATTSVAARRAVSISAVVVGSRC